MLILICLAALLTSSTLQAAEPQPVACAGFYKYHLQGVCLDESAIYWCFTDAIVKTDRTGKVIKNVPVKNHHGDLCHLNGKIYVAVNFGRFNDSEGFADSWVYVYDAKTLEELSRHKVPQVFYGAGGIAVKEGHFFVVGGLPSNIQENYVYEYDNKFKFIIRHTIKSGQTRLGIQTATFRDGQFWFGCYGKEVLKTDTNFKLLGKYKFDCGYGIAPVSKNKFYIALGPNVPGKGRTGKLLVAETDAEKGLVIQK